MMTVRGEVMRIESTRSFTQADSIDLDVYESIGTQNEKMLHKMIKNYLCPDTACHEFKVGNFIADIYQNGHITEIQTGSFRSMKSKLDKLLPNYSITVVYPVIRRKTIIEVDAFLGSKKPKKSPKIGSPLKIMRELYQIKPFLNHPHLEIVVFLVDVDEYRMKSIDSKGLEKINQFPKGAPLIYQLKSKTDYLELLPADLPQEWTVKTLKNYTKLSQSDNQCLVQVLKQLGIIEIAKKEGKAFIYKIKENNS